MKLNRKLVLFLSLVLSLALATGGTLAYLSDTDADVNTMTLGNVYIVQNEQEWNADDTALQPFTQDKPLLPYVGELGWESDETLGNEYRRFTMENVVDKYVTVTNTGKSDAYVRTIIALEMGEYETIDEYKYNIIGTSTNAANGTEYQFADTWIWDEAFVAQIDGKNFMVMVATHQKALEPKQTTIPSLLQVYLNKECGNEEVAKVDGNGDGKLNILVLSQAVQTAGFENAEDALNTAFGVVDTTTVNEWMGSGEDNQMNSGSPDGELPDGWADNNPPVFDAEPVATADNLVAALEDGKDVVLTKNIKIDPASMSNAYGATGLNITNGQTIDGNGYTIDIKGAGGTWDSGINMTGGTIKNVTITGSFRGIFINHNSPHSEKVVLENVTITGTTYTISCDQGTNHGLLATNSTFNGWTSYAATLGEAKFVNCNFNEGNGYAFCRPYAPTEFVGCDFAAGYRLDARAAVTFENCTIGGEPLTADNLATLVTSTAKVTLK